MRTQLSILLLVLFCAAAFAGNDNDGEKKMRTKMKKQGWLGVGIQDVTPKFAREKDLKIKEGAYINSVSEDSPADSAGFKEGDVITEFNGKKIETSEDLMDAVRETPPGTKATAKIVRNGENKSIAVNVGRNRMRIPGALGAVRAPRVMVKMFGGDIEGMDLMDLNKQLGEYFEAPNGKGVLVQSVEKDENGAKAGIKAGDVIIKVGTESVSDMQDIREAIDDLDDAEKVSVELLRKGKKMTVTLELSEEDVDHLFWPGYAPESYNFHFAPEQRKMEEMQHKLRKELQELPRKQHELQRTQELLKSKGV